MNVSCPECRSVFRVDPRKVPQHGVRARCSICGGVLSIARGGSIDAEFDAIGEGSTAPTFASYSSFYSGGASVDAPVAPMPAPEPPREMPRRDAAAEQIPRDDRLIVTHGAESLSSPFAEFEPRAASTFTHREPTPPGAPLIPPAAPHRMTPSGSRPRFPSPGSAPHVQPEPASAAAAPSASSGASPSESPAWSRSAINPYLSSDPNLKARRLARVLVSDMVVYHPDKREEGLRAGTLKALFRDEIKKSYEEYIDQVGKEFADSTLHFQEALNEILAGGKRVF